MFLFFLGLSLLCAYDVQTLFTHPKRLAQQEFARLQTALEDVRRQMQADSRRIAALLQALNNVDIEPPFGELQNAQGRPYSLAVFLKAGGAISSAWQLPPGGTTYVPIQEAEFYRYHNLFQTIFAHTVTPPPIPGALLVLRGAPFFITVSPVILPGTQWPSGYVVLGQELSTLPVSIAQKDLAVSFEILPPTKLLARLAEPKASALFQGTTQNNFHGVWGIEPDCAEALFPIYDLAGVPVARYSVRVNEGFNILLPRLILHMLLFAGLSALLLSASVYLLLRHAYIRPIRRIFAHLCTIHEDDISGVSSLLTWRLDNLFGRFAREINRLLVAMARKNVRTAQSERSLRLILRNLPDELCIFDREGRLSQLRKQPEGFPPIPGLMEGMPLPEAYFDEAGRIEFKHACTRVLTRAEDAFVRLICRTPNMPTRYLEARLAKFGNESVLVVFTDISSRVREAHRQVLADVRQRQIRQRTQMNDFARFLAHDINNTVTIIRNTLELIQPNDLGAFQSARQTILAACEKSTLLAQNLMDSAGDLKLKCRSESPAALLHALDVFYRKTLPANITLQVELPPPCTNPVLVDPINFWRILANLIHNAADALQQTSGGIIRIHAVNHLLTSAEREHCIVSPPIRDGEEDKSLPGVIFELSDNGPGIPKSVQEHLFELFASTKHGAHHHGFGMSIVRALIEAHGGALVFYSDAAHGTVFRIWMPRSTLPPTSTPLAPSVPGDELDDETRKLLTAPPKPEGFSCLVVDDNPSIRRVTQTLLERFFKAKVSLAGTEVETLEAMRLNPTTQVILLDAHLGNQTSQTLCGRLRSAYPKTHILITSGLSREHIQFLFHEQHPDGILVKPFTLTDLQTLLASVLDTPPNASKGTPCQKP